MTAGTWDARQAPPAGPTGPADAPPSPLTGAAKLCLAESALNPAAAAPPRREAADQEARDFSIQAFGMAEWPAARRMLLAGYPDTPAALWDAGHQRLQQVPPAAADVPLGVFLQHADETVGVALMLPRWPQPGQPRRINGSSWAIAPRARQRALWMARHTMADPDTVYTALTPIPSARRMLQRIGFAPVSHQCVLGLVPRLALASPGAARVLGGPAALHALREHPMAQALADHHRLGCLVSALDTGNALEPLVWRPRRQLRVLPAAELLYARSQALVAQHAAALARHLLGQGMVFMAFEAQDDLVPEFPCTRLFQQRLARGPYRAEGVDHLYSELVYLHR